MSWTNVIGGGAKPRRGGDPRRRPLDTGPRHVSPGWSFTTRWTPRQRPVEEAARARSGSGSADRCGPQVPDSTTSRSSGGDAELSADGVALGRPAAAAEVEARRAADPHLVVAIHAVVDEQARSHSPNTYVRSGSAQRRRAVAMDVAVVPPIDHPVLDGRRRARPRPGPPRASPGGGTRRPSEISVGRKRAMTSANPAHRKQRVGEGRPHLVGHTPGHRGPRSTPATTARAPDAVTWPRRPPLPAAEVLLVVARRHGPDGVTRSTRSEPDADSRSSAPGSLRRVRSSISIGSSGEPRSRSTTGPR